MIDVLENEPFEDESVESHTKKTDSNDENTETNPNQSRLREKVSIPFGLKE